MQAPTITVRNLSSVVSGETAAAMVNALNIQVTRDYNRSSWVTGGLASDIAVVELVPHGAAVPNSSWHMELLDDAAEPGELGVHEDALFDNTVEGSFSTFAGPTARPRKASPHSARGLRADAPEQPLMQIYCRTAQLDGVKVSEVAAHELLEAAVDPHVTKAPRTVTDYMHNRKVIVEVGDPVQQCGYEINGFLVADFVEPAWFRLPQPDNPSRMSFRGSVKQPFELAPNGYISVRPIDTEAWTQIFGR